MTNPNTILTKLAAWLSAQQFAPPIREIAVEPHLPPSAYPHLALHYDSERIRGQTDVTAKLKLRISCAAGRPADAQAEARDLAHQLLRAMNGSNALGGEVKLLAGEEITYGVSATGEPSVATAEVGVTCKYHSAPL